MFVIRVRATVKGTKEKGQPEGLILPVATHTRYYRGMVPSGTFGDRLTPDLVNHPSVIIPHAFKEDAEKTIDKAFHSCVPESLYGLWDVVPREEAMADHE